MGLRPLFQSKHLLTYIYKCNAICIIKLYMMGINSNRYEYTQPKTSTMNNIKNRKLKHSKRLTSHASDAGNTIQNAK